ncbi:MAG: XRE family transcriptional regulator [Chitinophagaceae bacterium]|nr:MAG: XRE family transcriptional regulator [Chitinophagaceae bacterium]
MNAFTQYRRMQGLAATRIRLGLSQELFAMQLGISRSLLSKAENKTRTLPTEALLKFSALEMQLQKQALEKQQQGKHRNAAAHSTAQQPDTAPAFDFKKDYTIEASLKEVELQKMIAVYNNSRLRLAHLEMIISDADASVQFLPAFLEIQRFKLLRKLKTCGPAAQVALRHKITLLQAAAALQVMHPVTPLA